MNNSMFEIKPYWDGDTWVFDDDRVGLVREPFVVGVPEMINELVKDIPNAQEGFRMLFSMHPFPSHTHSIKRLGAESGWTWYQMEQEPKLKGWLCPALFKYVLSAPERMYVKAVRASGQKQEGE